MRSHTINKPLGTDEATDFAQRNQRRAQEEIQFYDSTTVSVEETTRGVRWHAKIPPAMQGGIRWQTPEKELNPEVAVAVGTLVYLSPDNPLVLIGAFDLVAQTIILAKPGIWLCVQSVPAQTNSGYNVPQVPYPGATGTPTGNPLMGDIDGAHVFWVQIGGGSSGGGNYGGTYQNVNSYGVGTIVRVQSATNYSGTTSTIGVFGCIVAVPPNGVGNQIPQFPEPVVGTVYWQLITFGVNAISTCANGTQTTYVNSSQPF